MRLQSFPLACALLLLCVVAPTADAQVGQQLWVEVRSVEIQVDGTNGRLMPLQGTAVIRWEFDVVVPAAAVCPGMIRMKYGLHVPPFAQAELSRSGQDMAAGDVPSASARQVTGFNVEAVVILDERTPAFYAAEIRLTYMASPVPEAPILCTAGASSPVTTSEIITSDYRPGIEARLGEWSDGILPLTLTNKANGLSAVTVEWQTGTHFWVPALAQFTMGSDAESDTAALAERTVHIPCDTWSPDYTGELRIIGRAVPGSDTESATVLLTAPPPITCPADDGTSATEIDESLHALPGAGLAGSMLALAFAALRRR